MGFWDRNDFEADKDRPFIKEDQKLRLAQAETPFNIVKVRYDEKGKFGARYMIDVNLDDGARYTITFRSGGGTKRDMKLAGMIEYFDENGSEPIRAKLRAFETSFVRDGKPQMGFDVEKA